MCLSLCLSIGKFSQLICWKIDRFHWYFSWDMSERKLIYRKFDVTAHKHIFSLVPSTVFTVHFDSLLFLLYFSVSPFYSFSFVSHWHSSKSANFYCCEQNSPILFIFWSMGNNSFLILFYKMWICLRFYHLKMKGAKLSHIPRDVYILQWNQIQKKGNWILRHSFLFFSLFFLFLIFIIVHSSLGFFFFFFLLPDD